MERVPEVFRHMPFPFPDGMFPASLGAVIQLTVMEGREPAREVVHTPDNSWLVGDGVNDPNLPGASVVGHMSHVIEQNSTVASLATLPLGHIATRSQPGEPWFITPLEWPSEG